VIHTTSKKKFIKAEIYSIDGPRAVQSEAAIKAAGKRRIEVRDYVTGATATSPPFLTGRDEFAAATGPD